MPTRAGARPGGHPSGYQFAWVERVERVSGTCHQDLATSPRATAPGVQVPRLAGALGFDAGQHLGELVALEYDGLPVRGRWFGTVAEPAQEPERAFA